MAEILKFKIFFYSLTGLSLALAVLVWLLPVETEAVADPAQFRAGEFLVQFKGGSEIYKFKTTPDQDIKAVIEKFSHQAEVAFIEPNYTFSAAAFPNDPDEPLQYYLSMINAKKAWSQELLVREQEHVVRRAVVAILDTGIDVDHPDLKEKIWKNADEAAGDGRDNDNNGYIDDSYGWDFIDADSSPIPSLVNPFDEDAVKHGTIVAGIVAAANNNGIGIAGVGWFVDVMPLRVLDSVGSGDVFSVIQAVDYAVANGADVVNMSFVGNGFSQGLLDAIARAYAKNIIVVAAAGNTDPQTNGINLNTTKAYPVCYDGVNSANMVIGVASVNSGFKKSAFSNYGSCIDIAAPGESFYSTQVFRATIPGFAKAYDGFWSGTSLSAPLVSGTVASIKALRPGFSASQIRDFLTSSAKDINNFNPGFENQLGKGFLDVNNFFTKVLGNKEPINESGQTASYVAVGLGFGSFPQVKLMTADGKDFKSFFAYGPRFNGPIHLAVGDVNNDGRKEVVTSPGAPGGPHVRVFNTEGQVISQFFAYEEKFRGGINVAVGDVSGSAAEEIIIGSGQGIAPEVKVFDYQGNLISKFLAFDAGFTGGVKVAVGDVDGDGREDIVAGAGAGGGPQVRIFDYQGNLISQFFAYNQSLKGGVNIAVGDLHNDGLAEIVVAVEKNSVPTVRIFGYKGNTLSTFFAYEPNSLLGVNLAVGDADGDGLAEIVTGKATGGDSTIRIFNLKGVAESEFKAHSLSSYAGGARPAVMD